MGGGGYWYSRVTGGAASPRVATDVQIDVEEIRGERGMAGTLFIHMTILLSPELTIHRAPFQQLLVRGDIHHLAFVQDHDLSAIDQ